MDFVSQFGLNHTRSATQADLQVKCGESFFPYFIFVMISSL
jgi:hypothetical protein